MKKWTAPLISLIIFLCLLAVILFVPKPAEDTLKEPERERLVDIPLNEIARVMVNTGPEALIFEAADSEGEKWFLAHPAPVPVDQLKVRGMINNVAKLYAFRIVEEDPDDLIEFGLDEPWGKVELELRNGTLMVLFLGDPGPIVDDGREPLHYAMLKDRPEVVLLDSHLMEILRWGINDYRRREILDMQYDDKVVEISIEADGVETTVTRTDPAFPDRWELVSPFEAPSDGDKVRNLIADLRFLEAENFVEDWPGDLDKYGLDNPSMRIKLTLMPAEDSPEEKILLVGHKSGQNDREVYVMVFNEPFVYTVKAEQIAVFSVDALALSCLRPFKDANFLNLLSISWNKPREEELRRLNRVTDRNSSEWGLTGRLDLETTGFDRFQQLLNTLQSLEATEMVPLSRNNLAAYGLDRDGFSIKVTIADRSVASRPDEELHEIGVTLTIGKPVSDRPGMRYAMIDEYPVLYVIAETDLFSIREEIEAVW